jgi:hypothetical protein
VHFGSGTNIENNRVQITSTKSLVAGIPQGMLGVNDDTAMAQGVGGAIDFTGEYHTNGSYTSFASVEGYKTLSNNGNYDGTLVLKARQHGGDQVDKLRLNSTEAVFNEDGLDTDFRVESDAKDHAFFLQGSSTKIGINQSNPAAMLDIVTVSTAGADAIRLRQPSSSETYQLQMGVSGATNEGLVLRNTASTGILQQWRANEVVINEDGVDRDFRVESDTNSHMLYVDGGSNYVSVGTSTSLGGARFSVEHPTDCIGLNLTGDGNQRYLLYFLYNGTTMGSVRGDANGVTYFTTSDRRLKDNIETITDGTDKLMAMNPVTHTWKADSEAPPVHGFIAQEMKEIVPEAVSKDTDPDEMMSMDYGRITPVIVAALQEANKKIMELENRINELEGK